MKKVTLSASLAAPLVLAAYLLAGCAEDGTMNESAGPTDPETASAKADHANGSQPGSAPCSRWSVLTKICLSFATFDGQRDYDNPQCEKNWWVARTYHTYYKPILQAFDVSSKFTQRYVCSLERIFVDEDLVWNANSHERRNTVGFRRSIFERELSLSQWMTAFAQYPFKGGKIDRPILPNDDMSPQEAAKAKLLPRVTVKPKAGLADSRGYPLVPTTLTIANLMAHEVLHIADYDHNVTYHHVPTIAGDPTSDCKVVAPTDAFWAESSDCKFTAGQYGSFSWSSYPGPLLDATVEPLRKKVDVWNNLFLRKGRLAGMGWQKTPPADAEALLIGLAKSCLTTWLSGWWPHEDITESGTWIQMERLLEEAQVAVGNSSYDLLDNLQATACNPKRQWLLQFMQKQPVR